MGGGLFRPLRYIYNYSINIRINNEECQKFISNNEYLPFYKYYFFDEKYFDNPNSKIVISFYYDKNEIEKYLSSENGLLLTYEFDCNEIMQLNGGMKNVKITFLVSNVGNIHVHALESRVFEEDYMIIENNDKIYKIIQRELFRDKKEADKMIEEYKNKELTLFEKDRYFKNYLKLKNNFLNKLYNIKNKVNENGLGDKLFENKKINEILDELEYKLNDSNNELLNLEELNIYLDKIVNNLISNDLKNKTKELKDIISNYQIILSEEYTKLLSGNQCSLNENQINDASNMLEHFIKKLNLIVSEADLNNINNEFENEIKKYF